MMIILFLLGIFIFLFFNPVLGIVIIVFSIIIGLISSLTGNIARFIELFKDKKTNETKLTEKEKIDIENETSRKTIPKDVNDKITQYINSFKFNAREEYKMKSKMYEEEKQAYMYIISKMKDIQFYRDTLKKYPPEQFGYVNLKKYF